MKKSLTDEEKIKQVEVVLDGGRVHSPFCNFSSFRKVEDCPTCKDLYLTENMTEEEFWLAHKI